MQELGKIVENFIMLQLYPGMTSRQICREHYIGGNINHALDDIIQNAIQEDKYLIIYKDKFIWRYIRLLEDNKKCWHDNDSIYINISIANYEKCLWSEVISVIEDEYYPNFNRTDDITIYKDLFKSITDISDLKSNEILWKLCLKYGGRIGLLIKPIKNFSDVYYANMAFREFEYTLYADNKRNDIIKSLIQHINIDRGIYEDWMNAIIKVTNNHNFTETFYNSNGNNIKISISNSNTSDGYFNILYDGYSINWLLHELLFINSSKLNIPMNCIDYNICEKQLKYIIKNSYNSYNDDLEKFCKNIVKIELFDYILTNEKMYIKTILKILNEINK